MQSTKLITFKDVYKIYLQGENEVRALDGVSLEVNQGEFLAIVGASGSGKSTLMNMLGCLDVPTEGSYHLEGKNVSSLKDRQLSLIRNKQIGFIFQGFNLIPSLSAFENVELPLVYRKMPKGERVKRCIDALEQVKLSDRMYHKPSEMSGGQQQRVAIARAIAGNPQILLADEPTGNLDSQTGSEVMKILSDLNKKGMTIILITHDMNVAKQASRVIRISDGKIVN